MLFIKRLLKTARNITVRNIKRKSTEKLANVIDKKVLTSASKNSQLAKKMVTGDSQQVLLSKSREILQNFIKQSNNGKIDPAKIFKAKSLNFDTNRSEAIIAIGYIKIKENSSLGMITVTFRPKAKKVYPPYVLLQQSETDYNNFINANSLGQYWHRKYYKKTKLSKSKQQIKTAVDLIHELDKLAKLSRDDAMKLTVKSLQKHLLETTIMEKLAKQINNNSKQFKLFKGAIKLTKKLII